MAKGFKQDKQWNWKNFWIVFCVAWFGQLAFGYPSSIIGVTLAQPAFLEYMGLLTKDGLTANADSLIGATSGVFQVYPINLAYGDGWNMFLTNISSCRQVLSSV